MFAKCVKCGASKDLVGLVFTRGGMVCKNCYSEKDSLYDQDAIIDVMKLYFTKLDKLKEEKIDVNCSKVKSFYLRYYEEYLGYESKSKKILDKINK